MSDYDNRINRVVDYIQSNLDAPLSIGDLSKVACFSEFHFNRVFKVVMGESVYKFVQRLRLEKSANLLLSKPNLPVTEIALSCGFATPSSFAKSFKNHFKVSATEWRDRSRSLYEEIKSVAVDQGSMSIVKGSPVWTFYINDSPRQVVLEDLAPFQVAYVRNVGPYKSDADLFHSLNSQLFQWAVPRGYVHENTVTLNIYHDSPEVTDEGKLRVMVAIPVEGPVEPHDSIGVTKVSGGKYATCRFLLKEDGFAEAWSWIFSVWLRYSGYQVDDRETFERCLGDKHIDGEHFYDVEICIPVKAR